VGTPVKFDKAWGLSFALIMIISSIDEEAKKPNKVVSKVLSELELLDEHEENEKLRPGSLTGYIGQDKLIRQLKLILESAKIREKMPEHILFYGQPGLGKTTLAYLVAAEMKANIKTIAAPALQKVGDVVSLLVNLEPNTVLFIDEIHRLKGPLEETLYSAMEDGHVDLVMGAGNGLSVGKIEINPFVLLGATTLLGKVSKPLKDRFPTIFQLEPYSESDILALFDRNLGILKISMSEEAKLLVCRRCRGVPRIANNILKRFMDLQVVHNIREIGRNDAEDFLLELGIHENGLTKTDLTYLRSLLNGSVSLNTLSGILLEDAETLEVVIEPYLIHLGYIDKSSEGRKLTLKGREFIEKFMDLNTII
jgi:holliday junction DNA helicase RuvB